jgi:hypothetical protein
MFNIYYLAYSNKIAAAYDKVYQLLAHGRWFSPGTPASSTTKTGRHDIAEILLKVALKHQKSNQIKSNSQKLRMLDKILHNNEVKV